MRFPRSAILVGALGWAVGPARAAVAPAGGGPTDYARVPFSDQASHGVLRLGPGLLEGRLDSARAFGSLAAAPNPAKTLLDWRARLELEPGGPLFASPTVRRRDGALWTDAQASQDALEARAVTLFPDTDAVLAVLSVRNRGTLPRFLRLEVDLKRGGAVAGQVRRGRAPALWMKLDRSQAAGRDLVDHVAVWLGGPAWRTLRGGAILAPGHEVRIDPGGLDLVLEWTHPLLLRPGQSLRVPLLLAWGESGPELAARSRRDFTRWALPGGRAFAAARARWARWKGMLRGLRQGRRLGEAAVLALERSDYAREAALGADSFSAEKGRRDAFFSVDTPWAALGFSELDPAKAEAAILDLVAGDGSGAVPPYTGEEKLPWDAAGLPLDAPIAWELYRRDSDSARAARFLGAYAPLLERTCDWWISNRGGGPDRLYAYALDEEVPAYARPFPAPTGVVSSPPALRAWSLALSSLVAWRLQLGAALAQARGEASESARLLQASQATQASLESRDFDPVQGRYVQGLDGLWPLYLGLEKDPSRAGRELGGWLLPLWAASRDRAWSENGIWTPWRTYLAARTLAEYGYLKESEQIATDFLGSMRAFGCFPQQVLDDGSLVGVDSAATAAVTLEFLLKREQQDAFLTQETVSLRQRFIQMRTLDGSFYMKRVHFSRVLRPYASIDVESAGTGPILSGNAFVFSSAERIRIQMKSVRGLDVSRLGRPGQLLFRDAHNLEMVVPARVKFLARFEAK